MTFFLLALTALADDGWADADEEILVYPDLFHRWDGTRWWVGTEQVVPTGLFIGQGKNHSLFTTSWQVKAVVACELVRGRGRHRVVSCQLEDVGLQAATFDRWQRESDRVEVDRILEESRAAMLGSTIELVVGARGRVEKVSVAGPNWIRPIVKQIMHPFDLELPAMGFRDGGQFTNYEDSLLMLPETVTTRGSMLSVHTMSRYQGQNLIQSVGEAHLRIIYDPLKDGTPQKTDSEEAADRLLPEGASEFDPEVEISARTVMSGVAILDRSTGIVSERVWSVRGVGNGYWHAGRLRQLGPVESASVGTTEQISMPAMPRPGLPLWLPVDPEVLGVR